MFRVILRKIIRNKWLVLSLLGGAVVAVAMVASVPLYTDGVLQRMLSRDLEQSQETSGEFPGRYTIGASYYDPMVPFVPAFTGQDAKVHGQWIPSVGLPVLAWTNRLTLEALDAVPVPRRESVPKSRVLKLEAASGAADHIRITHGRMYSSSLVNGAIEVVVTEQAFAEQDLRLDETYQAATLQDAAEGPLRVRVVGIYEPGDSASTWWYQPLWNYADCLLADYGLVRSTFAEPQTRLLTRSTWSYALDYHALSIGALAKVVSSLEGQIAFFQENDISFTLPMIDVLRDYERRERQLLQTLWFLQLPVLFMLGFYLCMVSLLIIGTERNEIAVLKSRGAGRGQIFAIYLVESLLIASVACGAGPPLGLLICKAIGASSGFLEFVHRAPLVIPLSARAFLYGAAGAAVLLGALVGPAVAASRTTIVQHKRARSRGRAPFWKRFFLDAVLLGLAGYGYYAYRSRKAFIPISGTVPLDPLVILVSTFFILGIGLLFLRFYPSLVRLLFLLGRRVWPPSLYAPLLHVSRSGTAEQLVMLFLILTLSNGILDARFARTINRNVQEKIQYFNGADITLQESWQSSGGTQPASSAGAVDSQPAKSDEAVMSYEPDFSRYRSLEGVDRVTRVFRRSDALVDSPQERMIGASFMAVVPDEFGDVAWFRAGLLPYHWNQYLNLLNANVNAFIVSQSFADAHHVRLGDTLNVTWSGQGNLDGIVFAFVPYWPTYNPWDTEKNEPAQLVVANLSYVQAKMRSEPYEVWIKKAPGATSADIYHALEKKQIPIARLTDATPALTLAKNDAMLQGINGALTMAFVAAMAVCLCGSLISWILSFQSRVLQFGIFRAIGLSRWSVIGMIAAEQVLTSVVAIAAGIVVGGISADLFVPLLAVTQAAGQQVPPLHVSAAGSDYVRLYTVVAAMLLVGLGTLGVRVARLGVTRALKLGEE